MAGNPTRIRRAPVNIVILDVEDIFAGVIRAHHIPPAGVDNPLGFPGGTAGVEDEERVLCIHDLRLAGVRHSFHHLVEIQLGLSPAKYNNMFHRWGVDDCLVNDCFELDSFSASD